MQKVVVITGASSGLGKELAELYLAKNYQLVLTGRKEEGFAEFNKKNNIEIILGDLRKTEVIEQIAKVVSEKYKRIDILINNAGVIYLNPIEENTEQIIDELLSIHIKAPILLTQKLFGLMKSKKSGQIINIVSTSGKEGKTNSTVYCAAKFGLDGFTKALRLEAKKYNIRNRRLVSRRNHNKSNVKMNLL